MIPIIRFLLPAVAACIFSATAVYAQEDVPVEPIKNFETWLDEFREEALSKGITEEVLDDALGDLDEPSEMVIERDKSQPETKQTFQQYRNAVLTQRKINAAREAYKKNKKLLNRMEYLYDVPPSVLVALWCLESNFGESQGSHIIVDSLATLAYDGRRSQFFRGELLAALQILQQERMKSENLRGSWAGAMGQIQFMPSSYLRYAVDYNKDGKRDIWKNKGDALASMANYLHEKGWDDNAGWGVPVSLPENSSMDWMTMKERLPLSTWKKFGVRQKNGELLQGISEEARLVLLDGDVNNAYLVYPNYDVLMDWNRSVFFATTVSMLADAIGEDE